MNKLKGLIDLVSLFLRTKYIELENKNKRIKSYTKNENNINAFIDLKNFRGTYDLIGFLIYLKLLSDIHKKKCNLIIFKNQKNHIAVNPEKEKKFLKKNTVDFRNQFITSQLIHLVEDFNPNIFYFNEQHEAEVFFNKDNMLVPNSAVLDKLIQWDNYYIKINEHYNYYQRTASLKAPEYLKDFLLRYLNLSKEQIGKGIITITLRESSYSQIRNSNLEDWVNFYDWLKEKNYYPIFIRDTEKITLNKSINEKNNNLNFINIASLNCNVRLALYELAHLNTGVSCGPSLCMIFSKYCKYLIFKTFVEDDKSNASLDNFEKVNGFGFGKQWPFADKFQKLIWSPNDNFDTLKKEFLIFENEIH